MLCNKFQVVFDLCYDDFKLTSYNLTKTVLISCDTYAYTRFRRQLINRTFSSPKMALNASNVEKLQLLGVGGFGKCFKVRNIDTSEVFAMKSIRFKSFTGEQDLTDEDRQRICNEVNLLKALGNHPNIIKYQTYFVDHELGCVNLLMEYCGKGDLAKEVEDHYSKGTKIEEDFILKMFCQLVSAVRFCHESSNILHRDIKPANVFLNYRRNAKLGDFGLACRLTANNPYATTFAGTVCYMSPEVVKENPYDKKADVWSLGCLLYELCALAPPFIGATEGAVLEKIVGLGRRKPIPTIYTPKIRKLIKWMLKRKASTRPSAEELFQWKPLEINYKQWNII